MEIKKYIADQPLERQNLLTNIHEIIMANDKTVVAEVGLMMGKVMLIYKGKGVMKYALSSVKNYMSLHAMPIYGSMVLHTKYKPLLPTASFQKGCINFINDEDVPLEIIKDLIIDCAPFDFEKMREEYLKSKKEKK